MKKVLAFQEFSPRAYSAGIDWRTIIIRYCVIASIFVVPALMLIFQYVNYHAPVVIWLLAAVVALYVPALLLVRRPSAKLTPDYRFVVKAPRTVDTRILTKAAASALAYFIIVFFACLTIGGDNPMQFHAERVAPVLREIFTYESPLSLVGMGFFILLVYTVVGGTLSMLYNQVKYVAHSITHRSAPSMGSLHTYTKTLLNGTAPELRLLRATNDSARKRELIHSIVNTLDVQDASPIARAMVKALRRAA